MKIETFLMLVLSLALPATAVAQVRNSGFGARGPVPPYFTQANVENFRKSGWRCPDAAEWPQWWWGLYGNAGTVDFPRTGGVQADGYAKLVGTGAYLAGYHGLKLEERNYVYTIWARGKGRLNLRVLSYGQDDAGKTIQLVKPGEAAEGKSIAVNSGKWVRYRPFEKWDIDWVDEPAPLAGVTIAAVLGAAKLKTTQACRPYHFEEPQQTVQIVVEARIRDGRAEVSVPAFRYHTMVVFRFARRP